MSRSFDLLEADFVTVGTVGEPGHRTFYLQVRNADETVTLKLEKQQVAALAQFLSDLLSDLPALPTPPPEAPGLTEPVVAEWAIGTVQLGYEAPVDRFLIVAEEAVAVDPDLDPTLGAATPIDPATARFTISCAQASSIAKRGFELVESGRPPCPLCGNPLDPEGHSCPRTNGHRPPTP
jgi:uncharacterized repeat protein (TIGR03847 family)